MWGGIYQSLLYSPFTPLKGNHGPLVPLSYSSDSGAARICQRGAKRGSKETKRGEGVGGGREISWKFVYENGTFLHINSIIRGSLCSGIDQFPTIFLISSFFS